LTGNDPKKCHENENKEQNSVFHDAYLVSLKILLSSEDPPYVLSLLLVVVLRQSVDILRVSYSVRFPSPATAREANFVGDTWKNWRQHMSIGKGILLIAGLGLGTAAVTYFTDSKYGKKRRIQAKKDLNKAWKSTQQSLNEYSKQLNDYSKQFVDQGGEVARGFKSNVQQQAAGIAKNVKNNMKNHNGWKPTSRMLGALGSGLAFYGASRQGLLGLACRTLSLTMFTRALLTPR
jgi:hypothetical protein